MDDLIREMIEPERSELDRSRRSRLTTTVVTVALAAIGVTSLTTSALFTDTETLAGTDFTTGTVQISPTMSESVALGHPNMAPGDTSYGVVTVHNSGSLQQRYTLSVLGVNAGDVDLAGEMGLAVWAGRSGVDVEAACRAGGTGALSELVAIDAVPTTATQVLGSTEPGQDDGDRVLRAADSEQLCVALHLPVGTTNTFQDSSAEVRLVFDAEQTANNA